MKKKKRKRGRVELPRDRHGRHIHPGDWLMFDEGPFHVETLTLYEGGGWTAGDDRNGYSDNLGGGTLVSLAGKGKG